MTKDEDTATSIIEKTKIKNEIGMAHCNEVRDKHLKDDAHTFKELQRLIHANEKSFREQLGALN